MQQVLNIFRIVKSRRRGRRFRGLLLVSWFSWVDSFPDAEFSKIWKADLEFSNSLCSCDEVFGLARDSLLLDSCHSCCVAGVGDSSVGFSVGEKFR